MTEVLVRNDDIEDAIRRFQRWFQQNLKKELHTREAFESKPERKRRKSQAAARRRKRSERRYGAR